MQWRGFQSQGLMRYLVGVSRAPLLNNWAVSRLKKAGTVNHRGFSHPCIWLGSLQHLARHPPSPPIGAVPLKFTPIVLKGWNDVVAVVQSLRTSALVQKPVPSGL